MLQLAWFFPLRMVRCRLTAAHRCNGCPQLADCRWHICAKCAGRRHMKTNLRQVSVKRFQIHGRKRPLTGLPLCTMGHMHPSTEAAIETQVTHRRYASICSGCLPIAEGRAGMASHALNTGKHKTHCVPNHCSQKSHHRNSAHRRSAYLWRSCKAHHDRAIQDNSVQ